jgi:hypothetical protein
MSFLKTKPLHSTELPKPKKSQLRISHLSHFALVISAQLSQLAKDQAPADHPGVVEAHTAICKFSKAVDQVLAEKNTPTSELTIQSQRSLLYLHFLSDAHHFKDHLNTLTELYSAVSQAAGHVNGLTIELQNTASIYRCQRSPRANHLVIHEAFLNAPTSILDDLAVVALAKRTSKHSTQSQQRIKAYIQQPAFLQIAQELKPIQAQPLDSPQGRYFDLTVVFEKVNQEYFGGQIARPNLVWTRNPTRRKLGHYQPDKDTIAISRNLDSSRTNEILLGFIMYHEMLHKYLGVKIVNGRRYAHTTEFRKAERQYRDYALCQQLLKNSRWTAK